MRISTRGRYALRMMLDIARNSDGDSPVSLSSVSERTGISHGYLEQLAPVLRSNRLVFGIAGRHGGYKLAAPASDISLRQIIEATIGPVCVVDCVDEPETCPRSPFCECRVVYALINQRVAEVLEEYTLEDLVDPSWVRDQQETVGAPLVPMRVEVSDD